MHSLPTLWCLLCNIILQKCGGETAEYDHQQCGAYFNVCWLWLLNSWLRSQEQFDLRTLDRLYYSVNNSRVNDLCEVESGAPPAILPTNTFLQVSSKFEWFIERREYWAILGYLNEGIISMTELWAAGKSCAAVLLHFIRVFNFHFTEITHHHTALDREETFRAILGGARRWCKGTGKVLNRKNFRQWL